MVAEEPSIEEQLEEYMKTLKVEIVCESKDLREGQRRAVIVKDHKNADRRIIVTRYSGKLYAFLGNCPHQ